MAFYCFFYLSSAYLPHYLLSNFMVLQLKYTCTNKHNLRKKKNTGLKSKLDVFHWNSSPSTLVSLPQCFTKTCPQIRAEQLLALDHDLPSIQARKSGYRKKKKGCILPFLPIAYILLSQEYIYYFAPRLWSFFSYEQEES